MGQVIRMAQKKHPAFARRLGGIIEEMGYESIRAFALDLGEEENTVSRWTRGETIPRSNKFPKIIQVIGAARATRLFDTIRPKQPEPRPRGEENNTG
jgi:transcriptional regulator with XRE-family HTH domain